MNKLGVNLTELTFTENGHTYQVDGMALPSVTTIINFRPDPFKGIDKDVLNNAADRGTVVHNAIEMWFEYGMNTIVDENHRGYFNAFLSWMGAHTVDPLATELAVYHPILRYAGKIDLVADVDGQRTIVDYKTSATIDETAYGMQLEAYKQALKALGVKVDGKLILQLKSDGTYKEVVFSDSPQQWMDFNCGMVWHRCWTKGG